ncbi:hypothetical protein TW65_01817 [Stemphylium lycopersici]|nr:hypothetical protein TW65_01817 [Stemphylium lycopersici]
MMQISSSPSAAIDVKDSAPVQEKVAGDVDVASEDDIQPAAMTSIDENPAATAATSLAAFNIVAHRKALEAALYENMETPRQMFNRCRRKVSIDSEYHPKDKCEDKYECSNDLGYEDLVPKVKCRNDNGFNFAPLVTKSALNNGICKLPLLEQVLSRILGSEALKFHKALTTPDADVVHFLEKTVVRLPPAPEATHKPMSIDQLSSATPTNDAIIYNASEVDMKTGSGSKSLEDVEAEMRAVHSIASNAPHVVDSAIVGYKIKMQGSEDHNFTVEAAATGHEQVSIPPPSLSSSSSHSRASSVLEQNRRLPTPPTPWYPLGLLGDAIRWNPHAFTYNANWTLPLFSYPDDSSFLGPNAVIGSHGDLGNAASWTWDYSDCLQYDLEKKWATNGYSRSY